MIQAAEALAIIAQHRINFGIETVPLSQSINRILKENWITDRPLPPYDRVTMDGIAINFKSYEKGERSFQIEGIAAAGMAQKTLKNDNYCLEVMTGSILPNNCDTVIPYEHLRIENNAAKLIVADTIKGKNVHYKGEDRQRGELVIKENTKISAAEIGVGASIGRAMVKVARLPKIMVISTGDELVEIDQQPLAHQIRRSNVYRILTTLQSYNIEADSDHILDNKAALTEKLDAYIERYDAIILSGGVSMGKFDYLPEVLESLQVKKLFHKIKQRPGKPFWFGQSANGCTIFGLPGNPVSSFLCYHRYFKTWLDLCQQGFVSTVPNAVLSQDVHFKPDLTYFLEVKLSYNEQGQILAAPMKGNGSGDLANLAEADAFMELPQGRNEYKKGEVFPIYLYR